MTKTGEELPDAIGSNDTLIHERRRKYPSRPRIPGEPSVSMLRPKTALPKALRPVDSPDDGPGDYTKLILRRRNRRLAGVGAIVVGAAIVAALFLFPLRSWNSQRDLIRQREAETAAMERINDELDAENRYLRTPEGLTEVANADLGLAPEGAIARPVDPLPAATQAMPAGWPYSLVTGIVLARHNDAVRIAAEAAAAAEAKAAAEAAKAAAQQTAAPAPDPTAAAPAAP